MDRILVDTNIVLDLLSKREDFYKEAQELFTLADQPFVTAKYLNLILENTLDAVKICASQYQDTIGVPVLFPKKYFVDLQKLEGEQGAKKLLTIYQHQVITVSPDFINLDIDTPEDYKKWLSEKPTFAEEIIAEKASANSENESKVIDTTKAVEGIMMAQSVVK